MSHLPDTETKPDTEPPLAYRVARFCQRADISEATFWKYKAAGKIRTFKIGKRVLIPAAEVECILEEGVR